MNKIKENTNQFKLIYESHKLVAAEIDGEKIEMVAPPEFSDDEFFIYSQSATPDDWKRILFGNYTVTYSRYHKIEKNGQTWRIQMEEPRHYGDLRKITESLL